MDTWLANQRDGNVTPVRAGRRMRWIDEALRPIGDRLGESGRRRLQSALAMTLGTEAVLSLKDSAGLIDDDEIVATLEWASVRCCVPRFRTSKGHNEAVAMFEDLWGPPWSGGHNPGICHNWRGPPLPRGQYSSVHGTREDRVQERLSDRLNRAERGQFLPTKALASFFRFDEPSSCSTGQSEKSLRHRRPR